MSSASSTDFLTVGRRAVLRYRTTAGEVTDVVGEVTHAGPASLTVAGARGAVEVPRDAVLLAHEVPPAPVRAQAPHKAPSAADLQRVLAESAPSSTAAWLHADNLAAEPDGAEPPRHRGYLLRAADGLTKRANSALALDDPGMPPEAALAAVVEWYRRRGRPPQLRLFAEDGARHPLAPLVVAEGWQLLTPTSVLSAATGELARLAAPATVASAESPDADYLRAAGHAEGLPAELAHSWLAPPDREFLSVRAPDGALAAIARLAVTRRWGVLSGLEVNPGMRRRGVATALLAAIGARLARRGIRSLALEVVDDNEAALALYRRLGFHRHHGYAYRRAPQPAGAAG